MQVVDGIATMPDTMTTPPSARPRPPPGFGISADEGRFGGIATADGGGAEGAGGLPDPVEGEFCFCLVCVVCIAAYVFLLKYTLAP